MFNGQKSFNLKSLKCGILSYTIWHDNCVFYFITITIQRHSLLFSISGPSFIKHFWTGNPLLPNMNHRSSLNRQWKYASIKELSISVNSGFKTNFSTHAIVFSTSKTFLIQQYNKEKLQVWSENIITILQ